ncbi:MAG: hypothetical protein Q8O44_05495, partial [Syntrophales bacterium]|nr:hypothetical protein [Syntrophales bacterium]
RIVGIPFMPLDPSIAPPEDARGLVEGEKRPRTTGLLIDATRDWAYPPVSLPRREFMEEAIGLWRSLGLPELTLKNPWYGYPLGYWSEEEAQEAQLAVEGRYFETGEKQKGGRRRI